MHVLLHISFYVSLNKFRIKIGLYFIPIALPIEARSPSMTGCNFPILSTPFNNDVAFAETSELSIGNSTVIYAITYSFIISDRLAHLLPVKFSGSGSIRESRGVVAKCRLGIRRCLWPYGKYTGPEVSGATSP